VTVAEIMTRTFEVVDENDSLLDAMKRLRGGTLAEDEIGIKCGGGCGASGALAGILTQSDVVGEILFPYFVRGLVDRTAEPRDIRAGDFRALTAWASRARVRDMMTRQPITVRPDATLLEAADTVVSKKVRSLPVVEDDRVVGILYRTALFRCIAEAMLDQGR
jgi:CBS domain-containing protein